MNSHRWRRFGATALAVTALTVALVGVAPTAHAATTTDSCASLSLAQAQSRILSEVNAARRKVGAPALKTYSPLNSVALSWSKTQAAKSEMSHNPRYAQQIPKGWTAAGENVAYGYTPTAVTSAWLDSKGHRENIQRKNFTHIGIGMACSAKGYPFYTQVFAGYKMLSSVTPKISGTPKVGRALTAIRGNWGSGITYSYKWYASGSRISGATGKTYTPKAGDAGKVIKVKVTGKKSGYTSVTKTSAASGKVAKASTLKTVQPRVSGTAKVGAKLTAIRGQWTAGTKYYYRWYASGKLISGATGKTLTVGSAQRGNVIKVKVIGKKAGYTTASKTSSATAKVR